jgi:hypothetical protein
VQIELVDRATPIFSERIYRTTVSEAISLNSTLMKVEARSSIVEETIGYLISEGDPNRHFHIDFLTGWSQIIIYRTVLTLIQVW